MSEVSEANVSEVEASRAYVTKAQYAKVHNSSKTFEEVLQRTGLKPASARAKIKQINAALAEKGHAPLKSFPSAPRGRQKQSIDDVIAAADEGLKLSEG